MLGGSTKGKSRRQQVRQKRVQTLGAQRPRFFYRVFSWRILASAVFVIAATGVALLGGATLPYVSGQRIDHPIYARVDFQVPNPSQTQTNRRAARASTPSYYQWNARGVTFDRIRADLRSLYEAALGAETYDAYVTALKGLSCDPDPAAYKRLRMLADQPDDVGRTTFLRWVDHLSLESIYIVRGLLHEPRTPSSITGYIVLEKKGPDPQKAPKKIYLADLVRQDNGKALQRTAAELSRGFSLPLRSAVASIVHATFRDQPTIIYDSDRTLEEMRRAEEEIPEAMESYERGKPFVLPGVLGTKQYGLLRSHHKAYLAFLGRDLRDKEAFVGERLLQHDLRQERFLQQAGKAALIVFLSIGLLVYTGLHQPHILEVRVRTVAFLSLVLGTLLAARLLHLRWPGISELVSIPALLAGSVLAIVYARRFALGAICMIVVIIATVVQGHLTLLLTLFTGVAVAVYPLDEIRSRTKVISSGVVTAAAIALVTAAGGLLDAHSVSFISTRALLAGGCALLASFVVSGMLPFIERVFGVATSLALLEWRDPTRPLLQLLAREAPGTYNHSLVLGTLAEAACERIGANGLLAQVGALYHDIGKIPKAEYFVENQAGRINPHDNLAPTMSLLIILGHVKDGIEMAREYKLPRALRQFIEEHHGTTVVRYFHYVASEKQPRIASGKHDREVPEAEFRYGGPKPRTRESAVVMLADGVEGAVRALADPTVGRIEGIVRQIVNDRLSDGQFGNCEITMREIRQVEEALVKSLCGIYHGRVAYPKLRKEGDEPTEFESQQARLSG